MRGTSEWDFSPSHLFIHMLHISLLFIMCLCAPPFFRITILNVFLLLLCFNSCAINIFCYLGGPLFNVNYFYDTRWLRQWWCRWCWCWWLWTTLCKLNPPPSPPFINECRHIAFTPIAAELPRYRKWINNTNFAARKYSHTHEYTHTGPLGEHQKIFIHSQPRQMTIKHVFDAKPAT